MLLSIPEPAIYFCEADEEHFFGWLQGLPAVKVVAGTPTGLDVTIETPIDKLSFCRGRFNSVDPRSECPLSDAAHVDTTGTPGKLTSPASAPELRPHLEHRASDH